MENNEYISYVVEPGDVMLTFGSKCNGEHGNDAFMTLEELENKGFPRCECGIFLELVNVLVRIPVFKRRKE
jgi:hypothetical protein